MQLFNVWPLNQEGTKHIDIKICSIFNVTTQGGVIKEGYCYLDNLA